MKIVYIRAAAILNLIHIIFELVWRVCRVSTCAKLQQIKMKNESTALTKFIMFMSSRIIWSVQGKKDKQTWRRRTCSAKSWRGMLIKCLTNSNHDFKCNLSSLKVESCISVTPLASHRRFLLIFFTLRCELLPQLIIILIRNRWQHVNDRHISDRGKRKDYVPA